MALISSTDANAQKNLLEQYRATDRVGEDRGHVLLDFKVEEKHFVENMGDLPTFDNGRWTNLIDLIIINDLGHDLVDYWLSLAKGMEVNCSDYNFMTYKVTAMKGISKTKFRDIAKKD